LLVSHPLPVALRTLEGRPVSVALRDGTRLDDCELVSAGPRRGATLWLLVGGHDRIVPVAEVADVVARV
jgi:hypothetical protein